ncbi:MAG: sulfurtransferase TusA family protein [Gammaproteobacteria bacterium]|nr:sulfurtransferase TusA family protein [Gammaproteobacteria bacterium]
MSELFPIAAWVDAIGTRCPVPLLRAKKALKTMDVGEYLEVKASDPSAKSDFEAMLKHLPHDLVHYQQGQSEPRVDVFVILKGR